MSDWSADVWSSDLRTGSAQVTRIHAGCEQLFETRLDDRRFAGVDEANLVRRHVDADNGMAALREAGRADRADVTHAEDADIHCLFSICYVEEVCVFWIAAFTFIRYHRCAATAQRFARASVVHRLGFQHSGAAPARCSSRAD